MDVLKGLVKELDRVVLDHSKPNHKIRQYPQPQLERIEQQLEHAQQHCQPQVRQQHFQHAQHQQHQTQYKGYEPQEKKSLWNTKSSPRLPRSRKLAVTVKGYCRNTDDKPISNIFSIRDNMEYVAHRHSTPFTLSEETDKTVREGWDGFRVRENGSIRFEDWCPSGIQNQWFSSRSSTPSPVPKKIIRVITKKKTNDHLSSSHVPQTGISTGGLKSQEVPMCDCQSTFKAHRCITPPSYSDALMDKHSTGIERTVKNNERVQVNVKAVKERRRVSAKPKPRVQWNESTYIYKTYAGLENNDNLDSYMDLSTMEVYDRRPYPCTYTYVLSTKDVDDIRHEVSELHKDLFGFYPEY
eukprot:CFRG0223T1